MSHQPSKTEADFLQGYLAIHDVPCPGCQYNLRGLTGNRCPECGFKLELEFDFRGPRYGYFAALVASLSCGVFFVLHAVPVVLRYGPTETWGFMEWGYRILTIYGLISLHALPVLIINHRKVCEWPARKQRLLLAATCVTLVGATLLAALQWLTF